MRRTGDWCEKSPPRLSNSKRARNGGSAPFCCLAVWRCRLRLSSQVWMRFLSRSVWAVRVGAVEFVCGRAQCSSDVELPVGVHAPMSLVLIVRPTDSECKRQESPPGMALVSCFCHDRSSCPLRRPTRPWRALPSKQAVLQSSNNVAPRFRKNSIAG